MRSFLFGLLQPASQQRYREALGALNAYCAALHVPFYVASEETQDYILCDCILDLHDEGYSVQFMRTMVAAAQKHYGGRRRYRSATHVVEGLAKGSPPDQAAPFPPQLALAVVVLLTALGKESVGVSLLLCFCGLLRISEALSLRIQDVLMPAQHRGALSVILLLRRSKAGAPHSEKVVLDNPRVIAFLQRYLEITLQGHEPHQPFCPVSYTTVRNWLQKALAAFGLPPNSFRTHSCRRGGATCLSMRGFALQDIMVAGRWASADSCKLYIRRAEVALARFLNDLTDEQWATIVAVSRLGENVFDARALG